MDRCRIPKSYPKHDDYLVERPSGEIESYKLPKCFSPKEFAQKLSHSRCFLKLRPGWTVFTNSGSIQGPCWLLIDSRDDVDPVRVDDVRKFCAGGAA